MNVFVFNDETQINSFGFILINAGAKLDRFLANPVMLLQHNHNQVVGNWTNLRIENSLMIAEPNWDEADPLALTTKGKVDRGFLKGCSVGLEPLKWELMTLPDGQVVPACTEWELMESSVCAVPANGRSLRLYAKNGVELTEADIKLSVNTLLNQKTPEMSVFKLSAAAFGALKLAEQATDTEVSTSIIELATRCGKAEQELADIKNKRAEALITGAISKGQLTADKKDSFMKLALADFDQAKTIIDSLPGKKQLSGQIKEGESGSVPGRENWNLTQWRKEDPQGLQLMKTNDPERFNALLSDVDQKLKAQGAI